MKKRSVRLIFTLITLNISALMAGCTSGSNNLLSQAQASATKYIQAEKNYCYSIIIDAGSSGSRLHLFKYNSDIRVKDLSEITSFKVMPGLSSFVGNEDAAGDSISNLLAKLDSYLKDNKISHDADHPIKVSIMATAGMRSLSTTKQQKIYSAVNSAVNSFNAKSANNYLIVNKIGTISGEDEGLYDWLDVNYLKGNFNSNSCAKETFGALDMGGASTQIAFNPAAPSSLSPNVHITVAGCHYDLFIHSFLGLGQDQALAAMNQLEEDDGKNSCYPSGYVNADIQGQFNAQQCERKYHQVTAKNEYKTTLKIISKDAIKSNFIVFSGAYSTLSFFKAFKQTNKLNHDTIATTILETSSKSYQELENVNPGDPYLPTYCANAIHLNNLFYALDRYNLKNSNVELAGSIQGTNLDWALGAQLAQIYLRP